MELLEPPATSLTLEYRNGRSAWLDLWRREHRFDGISRTVYHRFARLPHSVTFIAVSIRGLAFRHTIVGRGTARLSV